MAVALDRVKVPELPPEVRVKSYDEAVLGYSRKLAVEEASRCIDCKTKPCTFACPALTRAPEYIQAIARGDFDQSLKIALETYPIPGTLGRTCFHPCEDACVVGFKGEPIAICTLKRAAFDYGHWPAIERPPASGKSAGVVGSGPAGLQVAYDLARQGHAVTVYEALPRLGGMLTVGIPEYRLPRDVVDRELQKLSEWGVQFEVGWRLGEGEHTLDWLLGRHDLVFLGVGCHGAKAIRVPGEDAAGVTHAVDWLRELELGGRYDLTGQRLVIIGGGSTAMDVARNALRLGARSVHIVYRRGRGEMTASPEEVVQARDERIRFLMLANPIQICKDDRGHVKHVEFIQMEMGAPDRAGRRSAAPIEGSEFLLAADQVILAVGQNPSQIHEAVKGKVQLSKWGDIVVDAACRTSHPRIFAAGDIAMGPSSIIEAIAQARKAAQAMNAELAGVAAGAVPGPGSGQEPASRPPAAHGA
ncbi:MAG TPA: NAD(P)-dependent oxidoreductase [Candidatus Thermoplasmatota archaeon]|nr:NAD(P)-dependent oxidoreductase [Candidatus Thermoplasmatota archaeon]